MKKSLPVVALLTGLLLVGQTSSASKKSAEKNLPRDTPLNSIYIPAPEGVALSGLTISSYGRIFVTAQGIHQEERKSGQIYVVQAGTKRSDPVTIITQGGEYDAFFGHVMDPDEPHNARMFVCANSKIPTVAPSVVVFDKIGNHQFVWRQIINLSNPKEFCRNIIRYDGNKLLALNARPQGSLDSVALYAVYPDDESQRWVARPFKTYRDVFPKEKSITAPTAGITGIAAIETSQNHYRLALSGQPERWIETFDDLGPPSLASLSHGPNDDPYIINAIAFQTKNRIIVTEENTLFHHNNGHITLYDVPTKTSKFLILLQTPSDALALSDRDPYGKTSYPVAFVLRRTYDKLFQSYKIDEYILPEVEDSAHSKH